MGKSNGWALRAALLTAAIAACGPAEDSGWIDGDAGAAGPAPAGGSSSGGSGGASADAGAGEAAGSSGGNAGSGSGSSGAGGGGTGSEAGAADAGAGAHVDGGAANDAGLPCTPNTVQQGSSMRPGDTCIACHAKSNEVLFSIAGTVFGNLAEPTLCDGVSVSGAQVVITDANKNVVTLSVNSVGNFSSQAAVATPYTAAVTYNGNTMAMTTSQTSGDCNACHTAKGANGAPGRIVLP